MAKDPAAKHTGNKDSGRLGRTGVRTNPSRRPEVVALEFWRLGVPPKRIAEYLGMTPGAVRAIVTALKRRGPLAIVPPGLHERFNAYIAARDWHGALMLVRFDDRVSLLRTLWPSLRRDECAEVFAYAVSTGGALIAERPFLLKALRDLRARRLVALDGDAARERWAALPKRVTIQRGTVAAERHSVGISWTLDRDRAVWFATNRGSGSPPVLVTAEIARADVGALIFARNESEVLVHPRAIRRPVLERL